MPDAQSAANSFVFRVISAERGPSRTDRQDLPSLDLVGAAIARAARLAAAEDRPRSAYALLQRSQAAELLRAARNAAQSARTPTQRPHDPLFADLAAATASDEGCVIPATARSPSFVWRFHPATAEAGAPIASSGDGALA